jgi:NADH-quinone oxidoreductase subunit N
MLELAVNWNDAIAEATRSSALLAPECVLVIVACAALLIDLVTPRERSGERIAWIALLGAFGALYFAWKNFVSVPEHDFPYSAVSESAFWGAVCVDRFASFFKIVILFGTIFSVVLCHESRELAGRAMGEFYGLLLMAVAGMCLMVGANDMVTAFLSIELVSVPSFALVAYIRRDRIGTEAAIKYVMYSAFCTGMMLFGLSILFGLTGSTSFGRLTSSTFLTGTTAGALTMTVACLLAFSGFAFKMAAAPFHFWAPDVYQGAPTPVTAWLSVTSKAAGVGLFTRFVLSFAEFRTNPLSDGRITYETSLVSGGFDWATAVLVISALTMTIGNFGALFQTSVKRLLAYSSVAHVGYILMGIASIQALQVYGNFTPVGPNPSAIFATFAIPGGAGATTGEPSGGAAAAFYVAAYLFMNLGAFACVIAVTNVTGSDDLSSFRGLGRRAPIIALAMAMFLFGLIGLPPTAGFSGKLQLFMVAIAKASTRPAFWWLVGIAGINSVVAVYYYLRVVKAMFFDGITDPASREPLPVTPALTFVCAFLVVPVLGFGLAFDKISGLTQSLHLLMTRS